MVKWAKIWLLMWLPLMAVAQQPLEAIVVDAQTRQVLPYASIFISRTNSTITNAEGGFRIVCNPTDVIRISYVGYKTRSIAANKVSRVIEMTPMENSLDEVTVLPTKTYLEKAIAENVEQLRKHRKEKANFFYRQTAFTNSVCYEFIEAFLSGQSALWLRNLALNKGRFAGIQPDSLHYYSFYANFFTTSQIQITPQPGKKALEGDRYPLTKYYEKHYDISCEWIGDGDDRLLAAHFSPKPTNEVVLDATLYFDGQTFRLRKMEGNELNLVIEHQKQRMDPNLQKLAQVFNKPTYDELIETEFHYVVTMTEDRGFLEVQSVAIDEQHQLYDKTIRTNSVLFNVGDREIGRGRKLGQDDNLHDVIIIQGYDSSFWKDNEIVLRTPIEEEVQQLFEGNNLFGVFK